MPSKSADLQNQINEIDAQIQAGASDAQLNVWETQKSDLKKELDAALADEQRNQAQEQAVESITLPYDFNDILSDGDFKVTKANDMITEVVRDFQRQSNAEHNAELDQVKAGYEQRLKAADEREAQLQRQNTELQTALEAERQQAIQDAKEHADLLQQIAQLGLDKQDAESKRDVAVKELEAAKAEIARLEQVVKDAPKAKIDITPTDKLAQMVKESAAQKAARGLERWNQNNPDHAVAPLEFPVLPTVANQNVEQSNTVEQVNTFPEVPPTQPEADPSATGNQPVEQVVAQTTEETTVTGRYNPFPQTLNPDTDIQNLQLAHLDLVEEVNALKAAYGARLDNIERHANLSAVA